MERNGIVWVKQAREWQRRLRRLKWDTTEQQQSAWNVSCFFPCRLPDIPCRPPLWVWEMAPLTLHVGLTLLISLLTWATYLLLEEGKDSSWSDNKMTLKVIKYRQSSDIQRIEIYAKKRDRIAQWQLNYTICSLGMRFALRLSGSTQIREDSVTVFEAISKRLKDVRYGSPALLYSALLHRMTGVGATK